jgi:hypothetical protein
MMFYQPYKFGLSACPLVGREFNHNLLTRFQHFGAIVLFQDEFTHTHTSCTEKTFIHTRYQYLLVPGMPSISIDGTLSELEKEQSLDSSLESHTVQ